MPVFVLQIHFLALLLQLLFQRGLLDQDGVDLVVEVFNHDLGFEVDLVILIFN